MRTPSVYRLWLMSGVLLGLIGCEDKKETSRADAAVAPASSEPAAQKQVEPAPQGCQAKRDVPTQLGEVHGDVFGFIGDSTMLYYSTWQLYGSRGDLGKFRKDGQGGQPLTSLKLEPRGMALDNSTIFYTSGIRLNTISKEGNKEGTLDQSFSSQYIALDGDSVYGVPGNYGPYDRLVKISKKGGESTELASAKRPSVSSGPNGYNAMAVDDSGIYVVDSGNNRILKFATSPGKPKPLATNVKQPAHLGISGDQVYFTLAAGDLMAVPKAGGKAKKLATGLVEEAQVAADDKGLYAPFAGSDDAVQIQKINPEEGTHQPVAIAGKSRSISAMTLDADCVYWVERIDAGKSLVFALGR